MNVTNKIIKITSDHPGHKVAIFVGVHGNETVGIIALQEILPNLKLKRGTVYAAFANVPAIEQNMRVIKSNLNRRFFAGNNGTDYEDVRARELMRVLDECDALLDLHSFGKDDPEAPFIICEDNALDLATKFEPDIVSIGWTCAEPGATDGYMYKAGKIGICIECGPLSRPEEFKPLAIKSVYQFLKYYDLIETDVEFSTSPKKIIKIESATKRKSEDFYLNPALQSFQQLKTDQILGKQGITYLLGKEGDYIIFPRPNAAIGAEAYLIGRDIDTSVL